ncbi:MAG: extracellular solute-binding protein [Ignavibacteria bacterium]|jgi:multiple sugar transport system substrate-binding protein
MNKKSANISYYIGGILILTAAIIFLLIYQKVDFAEDIPTTTEIFLAGHISEAHHRMIDRFNSLHKGEILVKSVNLSFEKFATNERKELFARFLRSESDKIDVFSIDQIWVSRFSKWCEPLENHISYQERKQLLSYGLEACISDKHLVAVPTFVDIALMYYREDLLEKYLNQKDIDDIKNNSITWEKFIEIGTKLKNTEKPYYVFQGKAYEGLVCSFIELLGSQGVTLYDNKKLQLDTPEAKKALNLLVDMIHKYRLTPEKITGFEENRSYDLFIEEDALFLRGWPNLGWHFEPDSLEKYKVKNIGKTYLPHFQDGKIAATFGGWNLMVSKFSKHKEEAIEFIKYCLSEEAQLIMLEEGSFLPTIEKMYTDSLYIMKYPQLAFYKEYFKHGVHRPALKNYTKISEIISRYVNLALGKKMSVEDALKVAQYKIEKEIFSFN